MTKPLRMGDREPVGIDYPTQVGQATPNDPA